MYIYLDYVFVFFKDIEKHFYVLDELLISKLSWAGLKVKLNYFFFFFSKQHFWDNLLVQRE